jgi:diadenosine tetraphosphate (Ap4A) HIT family hydrolase
MTPDRAEWKSRVGGAGCPLCAPRAEVNDEWDLVAKLSISSAYLAANQTYRGQCLLIFDPRHAARPDQLSPVEWASFSADLQALSNAVTRAVQPDHVNVASLGNVVPHLHWHVIPRYLGDARWGSPIWTTPLSAMPDTRLDERARAELIAHLRQSLSHPR